MMPLAIERWENFAATRDLTLLDDLLADDVIFESPIVHTPQIGRVITGKYLMGAIQVLGGPEARIVRRWYGERSGVLEVETEIDGVKIDVVDIISWNAEDRINHFKVLVRPLKAINVLHQAMGQLLTTAGAPAR